jgi:5-methyltetrahydropteroyltriglutamate--homocysteine methyltransferase
MSSLSVPVSTLGVPRIGPRRELKSALELYWSGKSGVAELLRSASGLRVANWARQHALGITRPPSNDFSLYDHVLDTTAMVGAIPEIYRWTGGDVPLDTYFAMARGSDGHAATCAHGHAVSALEMTKWFDTNYHYMVPELRPDQEFSLASTKPIDQYLEAKALGYDTRPVLVGPVTYLRLAKSSSPDASPLSLIDGLIPVYVDVLKRLADAGARWVQIDEPCLVLDLDDTARAAFRRTYEAFAREVPRTNTMLTTYFGTLGENLDTVADLPVAGLHLDLVRGPEQLDHSLPRLRRDLVLSLGVIDGRNVWRADLARILDRLEPIVASRGVEHVELAPSCSLLHVPVDLEIENDLDPELQQWLAFSIQKMRELSVIGKALAQGRTTVRDAIDSASAATERRRKSSKVHDPAVAARVTALKREMSERSSPFAKREGPQRQKLSLPAYPTTTIGSFPQTQAIRQARAEHSKGALSDAEYQSYLQRETESAIRWQEEIGLDVLVHGEFERNDMVQYFGEQLLGFAFTQSGWVQSYGSRCVRPPILFGDVSRPKPMTVDWWRYAQSLTNRPVKGMVTGPVTILNWSFVRDDIPRSMACRQIALAIRDEVVDLEGAGAKMIQIDEAALREGLPLRRAEWQEYLDWAVECFRISASGVRDSTQIHTHMCYSEFNDIIAAIIAMDADVISIESARSRMELLDAFQSREYPNDIGPGVYDIHSPRVPQVSEMVNLIELARQRVSSKRLWVNPDCGLKTRKWDEVRPALVNMVAAARTLRETKSVTA